MGFVLVFFCYYGFMLCSMQLTSVVGWISTALDHCYGHEFVMNNAVNDNQVFAMAILWTNLSLLFLTYLCYTVFFYVDRKAIKVVREYNMLTELQAKNAVVPLWRNILHWILMWPALLLYSISEYYSIWKVAIMGRKVCGHTVSSKDGLDTNSSSTNTAIPKICNNHEIIV